MSAKCATLGYKSKELERRFAKSDDIRLQPASKDREAKNIRVRHCVGKDRRGRPQLRYTYTRKRGRPGRASREEHRGLGKLLSWHAHSKQASDRPTRSKAGS